MSSIEAGLVIQADAEMVVVSVADTALQTELALAGFIRQGTASDLFARPVKDDAEKASVFSFLRERGFAWSRGREWCPAEVFEWLRDQKLIAGTFKAISWKSPTEWVVRDE